MQNAVAAALRRRLRGLREASACSYQFTSELGILWPLLEVRAVRQFAYGYLGYFGKVAGAVNLNSIEPADGHVGELSVGVENDIDVIRDLGTGAEASVFILDLA
jgi:hypothetical protein